MEAEYRTILETVLPAGLLYDGVRETPGRAAKAMAEMTSGYSVDISSIFKVFESEGYDEMVVERNIAFASLCEHHMLPFTGVAHVGYIPNGNIVGLSKLARVVDAYARRLQVQERITVQVADALERYLAPVGLMVVLEATHSCMALRGVQKDGVVVTTSALRGLIKENHAARAEALALMGLR